MRYVILRDDDTNALTPVECLEKLYRPFLDRCLPVNLAVIPEVATNVQTPDGKPEGFLTFKNGTPSTTAPVTQSPNLVRYLHQNPLYRIVQHGCHHDCFEFDRKSPSELSSRLERGMRLLGEAGFPQPLTFVAPHDRLSRAGYRAVAKRFRVISTGWFELRRLPTAWWPGYLLKKMRHAAHWRVGGVLLLSHPGCLLSSQRDLNSMLDSVINSIQARQLTVLVTHWWEYFPDRNPNNNFIQLLHQIADYLASQPEIKVISFADVAQGHLSSAV